MQEAIHTPGMMDNPGEMENQILAEHSRKVVDSSLPEVRNPEADRLDSAGMEDMQAGSEALLRGEEPVTPKHVRDKQLVDQRMSQAYQHLLDFEASRLAYQTLLVF